MAGAQHAVFQSAIARRKFLSLCIHPGNGACLPRGMPERVSKGGPGLSPILRPTTTTHPLTPSNADWSSLGTSLEGSLIRPTMPAYITAHQLFNPRFDGVQPTAIAYCASP